MSPSSALHLSRDALNGVVSRKYGAFLPCHQVRQVVAGKVGSSLRLLQLGVGLRTARNPIIGEAAKGIRNLQPADLDSFLEQLRAAGVQRLHCRTGSVEFGLDGGKRSKRC